MKLYVMYSKSSRIKGPLQNECLCQRENHCSMMKFGDLLPESPITIPPVSLSADIKTEKVTYEQRNMWILEARLVL